MSAKAANLKIITQCRNRSNDRIHSIDGTLTVWLSRDTGNPDVKHFVYHHDR